ncbi:Regulatory protein cys-like protein [Emericellopsis cladophorae]|uniref:Regulatory protein cys-like protein n=1 Tax=Emericellopsis cladophorae TaxID=2686198 RepID=A0A9P9XXR9_9HYPO|nr:Regulatory protein cys-like protein [Emericellopsis cladophorae]KAI6779799.1 Regulatory protein cys-like protein [Emericellopsis cladophorae]
MPGPNKKQTTTEMANYHGRKAPNVSQYIRDLNAISPQDNSPRDEGFNLDDELFTFTNTQFFDLDSGQNTDFQAPPAKSDPAATPAAEDPASVMGDISNMDFMNGEFNFGDFNAYQAPAMGAFPPAESTHSFQPVQPSHGPAFPGQVHPAQPSQFQQPTPVRAGDKRKSSEITSTASTPGHPANLEEASRVAAEEDKRRRNTAASARFRIKKKQREQALEKSAKEMNEKVAGLESRVSQLETENKWLKNLLVEKNEGSEDITALWKEFTKHASRRSQPETAGTDG